MLIEVCVGECKGAQALQDSQHAGALHQDDLGMRSHIRQWKHNVGRTRQQQCVCMCVCVCVCTCVQG